LGCLPQLLVNHHFQKGVSIHMRQKLATGFFGVLSGSCVALSAVLASPAAIAQGDPAVEQDGPSSFRIYATNEYSGDVSIIDGDTKDVITTMPLGKRPRGIKAGPNGDYVYVALSGTPPSPPWIDESTLPPADKSADGIGMVNLQTGKVEKIIRGVSDPEQLAVGKDGETLYIASEDTGTAVIKDIASEKVVATFPVGGEPEGVTISPDGSVVYMTSEEDHKVSVIGTSTNALLGQFEVGKRPRSSAFSPGGKRAYVTGENDASITVVDTASHQVIDTIKLPNKAHRPMGIVVSPDGSRLYVATGRGGSVVALDADSHELLGEVKVGERPWGIAISPDGREIYTADGPSNTVSVVDTEDLTLKQQIGVGERPWGVIVVGQP
jgi:YVTN family beta-propeller protein